MKKLQVNSAEIVAQARTRITEIDAHDAIEMTPDPDVVFIDIRDTGERLSEGFIPNSIHCPRGLIEFWIDPESPYFKDIFAEDKEFIFHCASGWRSALTVATLRDMGFQASHLKDGFSSWVKENGPVEFPALT